MTWRGPYCTGCGAPRSDHPSDGSRMDRWPYCQRFRGDRPSWYLGPEEKSEPPKEAEAKP